MKDQLFKHVTHHNGQYIFLLNVLGCGLYPKEHWKEAVDAACAADLTKHYFRTWYHIEKSMVPSLDPETFNVMSYRLNVNLSDRASVEKSLPPGVAEFVRENRDRLDTHAETNRPERKPWEALRADPSFTSNTHVKSWVLACEGAEMDCIAFNSHNRVYFQTLVEAFETKFEESFVPLYRALRMLDNAPEGSTRLEARKNTLTDLLAHLEADRAYISTLCESFPRENAEVASALEKLEALRPKLV